MRGGGGGRFEENGSGMWVMMRAQDILTRRKLGPFLWVGHPVSFLPLRVLLFGLEAELAFPVGSKAGAGLLLGVSSCRRQSRGQTMTSFWLPLHLPGPITEPSLAGPLTSPVSWGHGLARAPAPLEDRHSVGVRWPDT